METEFAPRETFPEASSHDQVRSWNANVHDSPCACVHHWQCCSEFFYQCNLPTACHKYKAKGLCPSRRKPLVGVLTPSLPGRGVRPSQTFGIPTLKWQATRRSTRLLRVNP